MADAPNRLYFGDNLDVLRDEIPAESVDLVYLDPPFNSKSSYNILFKSPSGVGSDAQIHAFEDSWHWGPQAEREFAEILHQPNTAVAEMMRALRQFLGENDMMAYLTMMANRLLHLHRVLKPTGSLYLHCDPTAGHYLKIVLDGVFGALNFRNEVVWKRVSTVKGNFGQGSKFFDRNTDSIFFYTKSGDHVFNTQFQPYSGDYVDKSYKHIEPETGRRYQLISMTGPGGAAKGNPAYDVMGVRRFWRYSETKMRELVDAGMVVQTGPGNVPRRKQYLDEGKGVPVQSLWDDIPALHSQSSERLGYPTQKPLALLERIIAASSNPGGVVLDPFCGCGTAIHAAQKLGRKWIGIDITHLAITLIEKRLKDGFPEIKFEVHGTPKDSAGASDLADRDKYQFQWWACSLVNAQPYGGKKKGADGGIDGVIYFQDEKNTHKKIIVSVKGGASVGVTMLKDLIATVSQQKAEIGIFVTLAPPTKPMINAALAEGYYESPIGKSFPRIQILTVEELLAGTKSPLYPNLAGGGLTFKKAKREEDQQEQHKLI